MLGLTPSLISPLYIGALFHSSDTTMILPINSTAQHEAYYVPHYLHMSFKQWEEAGLGHFNCEEARI